MENADKVLRGIEQVLDCHNLDLKEDILIVVGNILNIISKKDIEVLKQYSNKAKKKRAI